MNKIEQIEELLKGWEASRLIAKEGENSVIEYAVFDGVAALKAALSILKEPSDTQMQMDKKPLCTFCKMQKITNKNTKFCGMCGRAFESI